MNTHTFTCKNCGNMFNENFCNRCGQKADTKRLNGKVVLTELFHSVTEFESGFWYTAKELAKRPGHSIREYIQGKRAAHADPFLMLMIIGGIGSLIYLKFKLKSLNSLEVSDLNTHIEEVSSKFFAILFIAYSVVFAIFDFILFHYKKYNFTEYFVMNAFIANEVVLFEIALIPVWIFCRGTEVTDYIRILASLIIFVYLLFVRYQFFLAHIDRKAKQRLKIEAFFILAFFIVVGWKTVIQVF